MNERIKELAEHAGFFPKLNWDHTEWHTAGHNNTFEKFAELIVKECVEVCAGIAAVRAGYNDADGRDTAYSCGDMIKEHFGVE